MDHKILDSVVEITRHRDLDSLELAFVATMLELMPIDHIWLFGILDGCDELEVIVNLEAENNDREPVHWCEGPRRISATPEYQSVIQSGDIVLSQRSDEQTQCLVPVARDDKTRRLLVLQGPASLSKYNGLITGFARIYGNYMNILHSAEHDKLTGLLNRRTFEDKLVRLLKSQRIAISTTNSDIQESSAWLAILDVDHFKQINDSYGHVYGDEILLLLAQQMQNFFADGDLLFRIGGEEFVIVLTKVSKEQAKTKLEEFCHTISQRRFPQGLSVTVSIGYAQIHETDYPLRIFDLADKALYFAKQSGRNQVCAYAELVEEGKVTEEPDASGSIELF